MWRVLIHKNMAARYYGVGEKVYEGADESEARRAFRDTPLPDRHALCLWRVEDGGPAREVCCRNRI